MLEIIQAMIALTLTRRDWKGYPDYLEHIAPAEDAIEKKLEEIGVRMEVSWDYQLQMYGLFPISLLYPGASQDDDIEAELRALERLDQFLDADCEEGHADS